MDPPVNCKNLDGVRTCLTRGQSIGLTLTAEAGFISITAVFILFLLIIRNVVRCYRDPPSTNWALIKEPADAYMLTLFTFDMLQAIGTAMDVRWVHQGFVQTGGFCTAQGVVQQLGETGVAMTTLVVAIHTFMTVWISKGVHSRTFASCVITGICLFIVIFVSVTAAKHKDYETPTPYWCWIGSGFNRDRIAGEYFWLWLTLFTSIILYIPLFLWNRGNLTVDRDCWWKVKAHWHAREESADEDSRFRKRPPMSSLAILAYPLVYSLIVLPLSVVRWITFSDPTSPNPSKIDERDATATFAVVFIYALSGAFNVLLLLFTRPRLLLFRPRSYSRRRANEDGLAPCSCGAVDGDRSSHTIPMTRVKEPEPQSPTVMRDGRLNNSADSGWDLSAPAPPGETQ